MLERLLTLEKRANASALSEFSQHFKAFTLYCNFHGYGKTGRDDGTNGTSPIFPFVPLFPFVPSSLLLQIAAKPDAPWKI
jgi:hypothetical protein